MTQITQIVGIAITVSRSHGNARGRIHSDERNSMRVRPINRKNPWIARWIPRRSWLTSMGRPAAASSSARRLWMEEKGTPNSGEPIEDEPGPLGYRGLDPTTPARLECFARGTAGGFPSSLEHGGAGQGRNAVPVVMALERPASHFTEKGKSLLVFRGRCRGSRVRAGFPLAAGASENRVGLTVGRVSRRGIQKVDELNASIRLNPHLFG